MQILRSCKCNPRLPTTDRRSNHGPCWWSVVHHCNPSPNQLQKLAKSRLTDRPTVRRSDHGPWSVSVDRDFPYPASDTNYGRPARTVIRSTIRRSDHKLGSTAS
ncbi:hypothetical protein MTR67_018704 [Solanum verrucosum]|uniref:Uncharacterized protein n=1 Tax=Solanum verrucosum TaxID=315347 RepID=A0AAF0QK58_SOLVR|nr:hypothetical protein MTR67_018704 [Solanum verrucosum]